MRSQESARGSLRQGLEWVGRGSRKVLRIWVSGRWGRGAGGETVPSQGGLTDTLTPLQGCPYPLPLWMLPVGRCQRFG